MKNYIVTHTFKSKEAKAKMMEVVGSMSKEDMVKSMSGENAKCARCKSRYVWTVGTWPQQKHHAKGCLQGDRSVGTGAHEA